MKLQQPYLMWFGIDMKTKDIRDVLQIAKLASNVDEVMDVAKTLLKYRPKPKTTDEN